MPREGADRPFCSRRCRMVDLGAWLLGHYRIPVVRADGEDALEEPPPPAPDDDDLAR